MRIFHRRQRLVRAGSKQRGIDERARLDRLLAHRLEHAARDGKAIGRSRFAVVVGLRLVEDDATAVARDVRRAIRAERDPDLARLARQIFIVIVEWIHELRLRLGHVALLDQIHRALPNFGCGVAIETRERAHRELGLAFIDMTTGALDALLRRLAGSEQLAPNPHAGNFDQYVADRKEMHDISGGYRDALRSEVDARGCRYQRWLRSGPEVKRNVWRAPSSTTNKQ